MNALSNAGLLSRFIGMVTDSRSFMSYPRHEYFRRVLCDIIGQDVARGELPEDDALLGRLIRDICYGNAQEYLQLPNSQAADQIECPPPKKAFLLFSISLSEASQAFARTRWRLGQLHLRFLATNKLVDLFSLPRLIYFSESRRKHWPAASPQP